MLCDDIKAIDFLHDRDFFPDDNGAWGRIKKVLEAVPTAHNSRYVAALDALQEWHLSKPSITGINPFVVFCRERLNAEKDPHCT